MKTAYYRLSMLMIPAIVAAAMTHCATSTIAINKAELKNVKTIAIMHFESKDGINKDVAQESEETFRGHFVNAGFNVVEREKLDSILKEVEISQAGVTGDSMQLGKMLGAQALLFGDVTKNSSMVKLVNYNDYVKDPFTGKTVKIEKTKNKKFYTFQLHIRLVSTLTGNIILTIKNKYPESDYDMTSSTTLEQYRDRILTQMGDDLKDALEED